MSAARSEVLVVAGEASGDRIAALVAGALAAEGVRCAGAGGPACRAAGMDTFVDTASLSAMGLADVVERAPRVVSAVARLARHVRRERPRAALLVNFTELNQRLGRALRARGTKVLWCVAPQVWAWRPGRLGALRDAADRMAVILPFEERLWRDAGYDAVYVGHPSVDGPRTAPDASLRTAPDASLRTASDASLRTAPREQAEAGEGTERGHALALLPGSRAGEVGRLGDVFLQAAADLVERGDARSASLVLAPGLDARSREKLEHLAGRRSVSVVEADPAAGAGPLLARFDVSLCASGTASLEAALAGAAPVVAYRMDRLGYALARRLVRTPHIALPNVLLGRRAYPELLQDEVTPERLASCARAWLERRDEALALAASLREILAPPSPDTFGRRVAELLLPWLG